MAIYMKYDTINGDVTESGHVDWIELTSFQFGVGRSISSPIGAAADRESRDPTISEVVVTKMLDKSSPHLFQEAVTGFEGKVVTVEFTRTDKKDLATFLSYKLSETLISGYNVSSAGDRPSETVSLNFTKVEMKVTPTGASGAAGSPLSAGYDLKAAKAF